MAQELAAKVGADRVSIEVGEGDPREAILNIAATSSSDLIVMGSHGRTGLTKIFMGSVSQAVSVHAPCAVAIVRGIVPKGKTTMQQTGMFALPGKKSNPAPTPARAAEKERDTTPHVPPAS